MGNNREGRVQTTLRLHPYRDGLATAGRQTTIPETALWQAQNVVTELDGLIAKRPGLKQWGQTIKVPDPADTGSTIQQFVDFLSGTAGFVATDTSSGDVTTTANDGALLANVAANTGTGNLILSYAVSTVSAGNDWSIRFVFKGTNLPEYTAASTTPNTFVVRGQGALGTGKEFAIWAGGLYYKNAPDDQYTLIVGTETVGAGGWKAVEIRVDDSGGGVTNVYVNDTLVTTTPITSSLIKDVSLTGTSTFEFQWMVEGTGAPGTQYSTQLSTPMYNDSSAAPFKAKAIAALKNFQYTTTAGSNSRALLCAAGDYVYHDNGLFNAWRPLHPKQNAEVFFTGYRQTIIWSDNNGARQASLWQWKGFGDVELLDDAPPVRFMTEHQQRVFCAGDKENPLRIYYSADRQPNVYFSPTPTNIEDEFDVVVNAGYIEIPGKEGDEVTALFGDYYGVCIAFTRTGVWRIDGAGPTSYSRNAINQDVGCETAQAVAQVANDLWFISRQGVHSLAATDKFGNIESQFPSVPIQNLWTESPSTVKRISRGYLSNAKLRYNPHTSLVYVAVPLTGDTAAENVFVYNVNTQKWHGPWTIDSRAMENVEIATPVVEVMMHGNVSGQIGYTDQAFKADYGIGSVDMKLESAYLDGRSIHPMLPGMMKTFKKLRLFVLPRGDWAFDMKVRVDAQIEEPYTGLSQNVFPKESFFLGADAATDNGDFRLDLSPDGILRSREEMGVIEINVDQRGYALAFIIEQKAAGQDLVIQGVEVEFLSNGYETEHEL